MFKTESNLQQSDSAKYTEYFNLLKAQKGIGDVERREWVIKTVL